MFTSIIERPREVLIIEAINVTAQNLTVEWQKPFDGYNTITHYSIHLAKDCNEKDAVDRTVNVNDSKRTLLKDLIPFSCYSIDIQAFNALGGSDRSLPVKLTTKLSGKSIADIFSCLAILCYSFVKLLELLGTFLSPSCLPHKSKSLGRNQANQME